MPNANVFINPYFNFKGIRYLKIIISEWQWTNAIREIERKISGIAIYK